jgi:hypothetical protein
MGTVGLDYFYSPILVERFIYSHSYIRRLKARFAEKHRFTQKEYDEWLSKEFLSSSGGIGRRRKG